jgi:hypothetical protein
VDFSQKIYRQLLSDFFARKLRGLPEWMTPSFEYLADKDVYVFNKMTT